MADINSELNRFNGTSNDALLLRNSLEGSNDPSTATKGFVGQIYVNSITGDTFVCKNTSTGNYVWSKLCPNEIGEELATELGLPPTASVAEGFGEISKKLRPQTGSYVGTGDSSAFISLENPNEIQRMFITSSDSSIPLIMWLKGSPYVMLFWTDNYKYVDTVYLGAVSVTAEGITIFDNAGLGSIVNKTGVTYTYRCFF